MEQFEYIKSFVETMETNAVKFYEKGNKSAGVRYRKQLSELIKMAMKERRVVLLT